MIYLIITCALSIALNTLLLWYIRKMLTKLLFISDNMGDFLRNIEDFSNHLKSVHELETFYGEPVLGELITHSKKVVENIKNYREIYTLTNQELEEYEAEEIEEEE